MSSYRWIPWTQPILSISFRKLRKYRVERLSVESLRRHKSGRNHLVGGGEGRIPGVVVVGAAGHAQNHKTGAV